MSQAGIRKKGYLLKLPVTGIVKVSSILIINGIETHSFFGDRV